MSAWLNRMDNLHYTVSRQVSPKNDEGGGFSGTLLSSNSITLGLGKIAITATSETAPPASTKEVLVRSCSACTFNNVPDADVCEICSTRLE